MKNMSGSEEESEVRYLRPMFTQELPANARVMCLADIDSDGQVEMVIGYSDRVVRAFRWVESPDSDSGQFVFMQRWQLAGQIGSITINYNQDHEAELMVSQPGATFVSLQVKPAFRHIKSEGFIDKVGTSRHNSSLDRSESFALGTRPDLGAARSRLNKSSHNSSGSKDIVSSKSETSCNLIEDTSTQSAENSSIKSLDVFSSKPEGKNTGQTARMSDSMLNRSDNSLDKSSSPQYKPNMKLSLEKLDGQSGKGDNSQEIMDEPLGRMLDVSFDSDDVFRPGILSHHQTRNKNTSTVIIGGITRGKRKMSTSGATSDSSSQATYYALATLDGSLILVENDTILWSLQVDHYLFALSKLDVTGNGKEEVVCCSWNGQTYIVNHSKEIVRYQFPDSVAAFCAGYFSLQDRLNVPCFVYATFTNRIYIYPNISLPRVESTNLLKVMGRMEETRDLLRKLGISTEDTEQVRRLYHWCLYGQMGKT